MTERKRFVLFLIILIGSLLLSIAFLFINTFNKQNTQTGENNISSNSYIKEGKPLSLIGLVWTSGLMQEEEVVLGISSNYQIVKPLPPKPQQGWSENTDGMYLINNGFDFSNYLGKCVSVSGKINSGWESLENNKYEINEKWTYNRSAMVVNKIDVTDFNNCIVSHDRAVKDKKTLEGLDYKVAKGVLEFGKRPAPDISYDFIIILDEPFIDEQSASGKPILTKQLDISPGNDEIFMRIIDNIGKKAEISGYMEWGYAESRFLRVDNLQIITPLITPPE